MSDTASNAEHPATGNAEIDEKTRRDFLLWSTGAVGAAGVALAVWPFIDQMNPADDTLALATVEVDLAPVEVGQAITVVWQGKPVFVRHRTEEEIAKAREVEVASLRDPQKDEERVIQAPWLVMIGICTHLGCIPLGQQPSDPKGDYGGWFCPCHGSHYDTSGRIRRGPAPENLAVPPYEFTADSTITIG